MLNTITVIAISKIYQKKAIPKKKKAKRNILGLCEYSKLKLIMQLRNYASNGIIIKRLEKRFLLKARGNDEHTMVMRKMENYESASKSNNIDKYDCSYAYGNLGVPFFPRDSI